jgi:hypothetical protein
MTTPIARFDDRPRTLSASRHYRRRLASIGVIVAVLLSATWVLPAHAAERGRVRDYGSAPASQALVPLGADRIQELVAELESSGVPREEVRDSRGDISTYALADGVTIGVPHQSGVVTGPPLDASLIGAGYERGRGVYVSFNKTDQDALSAGVGAALGVAICAAGPVACAVASAVIGAALVYVAARGLCPGRRELRIYVSSLQGRCV